MKIMVYWFVVSVMSAGVNTLRSDNIAVVEALIKELRISCVTIIVEDIIRLDYNVIQKVSNFKIPLQLTEHNDLQKILFRLNTDETKCLHIRIISFQ